MYEQNLSTYSHDFLSFKFWLTHESEHYIFHYTQGGVAEKDISNIEMTQENAYIKITSLLHTPPLTQKIHYYFYPDEEIKKLLWEMIGMLLLYTLNGVCTCSTH